MNWRVLGASVCGTSHQKRSQPCQDAWAATIRDDGLLLAAVADGAGSATRSQDGAEWAVQAAIAYLADLTLPPLTKAEIRDREDKPSEEPDLNQLLTQALQAARTRVIEEAEAAGLPVRECASTLILLVANHEGVAVAQIGDGAAVMIDESGTLTALSQPQQGEYANQTTFLTSEGGDRPSGNFHLSNSAPGNCPLFRRTPAFSLRNAPRNPPRAIFQPLIPIYSTRQRRSRCQRATSGLPDLAASQPTDR